MKAVSITEFKAQLSKYIRVVRRGGEVQVLERGVPVARLVGVPSGGADRERVARLVRSGVLKPGRGDARELLRKPALVAVGADVTGALSEDRSDRL